MLLSGEKLNCLVIDPSNFTPPYDQHLIAGLKEAGLSVDFLGRSLRSDDPIDLSGPIPEPFFYRRSERMRAHVPGKIFLILKLMEHCVDLVRLCRRVKKSCYAVVHFQWTPIPLVDRLAVEVIKRHCVVVLTIHDSNLFHGTASHRLQSTGWRRLVSAFDGLVVHTESSKISAEKFVGEPRKVDVIKHPPFPAPAADRIRVATEQFPPADLKYLERKVNMLLFGRLAAYKGIDVLFEALQTLDSTTLAKTRIVLAGRSAFDHEAYQRKIISAGLEQIVVLQEGFIPDQALVAYLAQCDVVLFPYTDIDASGALMQAMPYGRAIIASRIGVFDELLKDEVSALLVEPGSSEGLAAAIGRLASSHELRRALSQELITVLNQELSWRVSAEQHANFYGRLCMQRA